MAVESRYNDGVLHLTGGVWSLDGTQQVIRSMDANLSLDPIVASSSESSEASYAAVVASHIDANLLANAEKLGIALAQDIASLGGDVILREAKKETELKNLVAANVPPTQLSHSFQ